MQDIEIELAERGLYQICSVTERIHILFSVEAISFQFKMTIHVLASSTSEMATKQENKTELRLKLLRIPPRRGAKTF